MPLHNEKDIQQQEKIHKKKYEFSKSNQNILRKQFSSQSYGPKITEKGNLYLYFELI